MSLSNRNPSPESPPAWNGSLYCANERHVALISDSCPHFHMMEGAPNTRKTVVMCVRYRFSKIKLSGKVSSLEMSKFQAASPKLKPANLEIID